MLEVNQMVRLFLELIEMLKNHLLSTRLVLLLQKPILLFQKVVPLIFSKTMIQEGIGFGNEHFQALYSS